MPAASAPQAGPYRPASGAGRSAPAKAPMMNSVRKTGTAIIRAIPTASSAIATSTKTCARGVWEVVRRPRAQSAKWSTQWPLRRRNPERVNDGIGPVVAQFGVDNAQNEGEENKRSRRGDGRVQDDALRDLPLCCRFFHRQENHGRCRCHCDRGRGGGQLAPRPTMPQAKAERQRTRGRHLPPWRAAGDDCRSAI